MLSNTYFRLFPDYQEVFGGDLDKYRQHFLPLFSLDLRFMGFRSETWLHVLSVKELGLGGATGELTGVTGDHTGEDRLGFEVVNGRYTFDVPWDYFLLEQRDALADRYAREATNPHAKYKPTKRLLDAADTLPDIYKTNEVSFLARREAYGAARGGELLRESELLLARPLSEGRNANPEPELEGEDGEEGEWLEWNNLPELPCDAAGEPLLFVCRASGHRFHAHGADGVWLFYDETDHKAVICFEWT